MPQEKRKKKLSGYQNLINKRKREEERERNASRITQFFTSDQTKNEPVPGDCSKDNNQLNEQEQECSVPAEEAVACLGPSTEYQEGTSKFVNDEDTTVLINFDDAGLWPEKISHTIRQAILEKGPIQIRDINFPRDSSGRKFSSTYYKRFLKNGEEYSRNWLIYSISKNTVYCFCCKLMEDHNSERNNFIQGVKDWQHLAMYLNRHEKSVNHLNNYKKCIDLSKSLKSKTSVDHLQQTALDHERKRWCEVLTRIIYVIQFLSRQNLAFRGKSNKLYESNNGNFLKCIEMLEKISFEK